MHFTRLISVFSFLSLCFLGSEPKAKESSSFHELKFKSLAGKEITFNKFKGKKVLLVNVASRCGFTSQYKKLETLHKKHGEKITILGFPANNFGGQEPGTNKEILEFCRKNYGVSFQMLKKSDVVGPKQNHVYKWLTDTKLNGWNNKKPAWNFTKYLVDENGKLLKVFPPSTDPLSSEILSHLR